MGLYLDPFSVGCEHLVEGTLFSGVRRCLFHYVSK